MKTIDGGLEQLASAVRTVGKGLQVPPINASFCVGGRLVQPRICAVTRLDQQVMSVDILFNDAGLPRVTNAMKQDLAALAITLAYGVRFRYQILEQFAHRKLQPNDVSAFFADKNKLFHEATHDPRFFTSFTEIRKRVLENFDGEDRDDISKMYERYDQIESMRDLDELDNEALEKQIAEMLGMNQRFCRTYVEALCRTFRSSVTYISRRLT